MNIGDLMITSFETMDFFDVVTGEYLFTLDEMQNMTIANNEETTDVTGKNGRVLNTLKRNKSVTLSGTNGILSGGMMALQTGGDFETTVATVKWNDYLTVSGNQATTTYKATGTAGSEIETLYVKNTDGTLGQKFTQAAVATPGTFAYDPSTKVISFYSGDLENGTEIIVYYDRKIQANSLENVSDKYAKKATAYANALAEDKCANVYRVQFYFPKVDFNGTFNIEFGDSQAVHAFEARALPGACSNLSGDSFWTYTVFGANAQDHPALTAISVTTPPTKTAYTAGESFNASGMVVTATYAEGSPVAVTGYTVSPVTPLAVTDTTVTITYTEDGVTKTATQSITVTAG